MSFWQGLMTAFLGGFIASTLDCQIRHWIRRRRGL